MKSTRVLLVTLILAAAAMIKACDDACTIFCDYGRLSDSKGCAICKCKAPPQNEDDCPMLNCLSRCPAYKKDKFQCETCHCIPFSADN